MQYMCLIYSDPAWRDGMSDGDMAQVIADYGTFTESIRESGNFVAGDALQPTSTATTVRVRNGETLVTDGPFAETKEQLGGYYLVDAKDADEALAIAARIPGARHGSIEVRPLMVFED
jgi:hypothetical protein